MIEPRHVRYLAAATERGSFRRAAETLRMQRIRYLENKFGTELLILHDGGLFECAVSAQRNERSRVDRA